MTLAIGLAITGPSFEQGPLESLIILLCYYCCCVPVCCCPRAGFALLLLTMGDDRKVDAFLLFFSVFFCKKCSLGHPAMRSANPAQSTAETITLNAGMKSGAGEQIANDLSCNPCT